jgi:hypothetical protein
MLVSLQFFVVGLFLLTIGWSRVGLGESFFHSNGSHLVNSLSGIVFLLLFESIFLLGFIGSAESRPVVVEFSSIQSGTVMVDLVTSLLGFLSGSLASGVCNLSFLLSVSLWFQVSHWSS